MEDEIATLLADIDAIHNEMKRQYSVAFIRTYFSIYVMFYTLALGAYFIKTRGIERWNKNEWTGQDLMLIIFGSACFLR